MTDKRRDSGEYYPGGRVIARPGTAPQQVVMQWSDVQGKPQIAPLPERYREDDMKGKINEIASKFATVAVAALIGWTACADVTVQKKRKDQIYNDELIVVDVTGAGSGIDTNAVERIANAAVETNAVTVGLRASVSSLESSKLSKSDVVAPSANSRDGQAAEAKVVRAELDSILNMASDAARDANAALHDIGETKAALDNVKTTADDALWAAERLETNKADKSDVAPLAADIRSAYQYSRTIALYMTGNTNAWFAGTNYVFGADAATRTRFAWEQGMDAATIPCSMAMWEIRDGVRQCVWDQRDWPTWYWSFKAQQMRDEIAATNRLIYAAINEAVTNDSNHAWAKRYASTGRRNPDASTTFIDTPSVTLSPGMSWETVATVGGCGYWTIVGNGAVIGGSGTNATLNVKDFEGNSILEITKGQHMLAWLDSSDFVGQLTDADGWICFDVMANVKPTGYFSTTLVAADFVAETDENCPAQGSWEDLGGHVWRVHFLLKPGIVSHVCFAKFQVEVEGKTQIRHNADTVINGGLIFNGVKIAPVIPSGAAVGSTVTWKVVE